MIIELKTKLDNLKYTVERSYCHAIFYYSIYGVYKF